ncbi:MAG: ABC transporter permease [Candidatus Eremiobacteraeota bacterium]|nr:ABC transporter permease [Candidatus Eremiobacteraeota bacterium]MBV9407311.1 ABC transporter permease [Candidatus Eremiobacteraeota bacterium]
MSAIGTFAGDGATGAPAGTLRRELELIRITALRVLKVRYRGTALGVLWSFANPVLMTLLYAAIFGTAFAGFYGSRGMYMLSAFVGVVVMTFFIQATGDAIASVVANGGLMNKIAVPSEVFPLAMIAANLFQQCITTFPAVLLICAVLTHDPLRVLLVPFVLLAAVGMTAGFCLALAALYVFFRDLPHLWAIIGFVIWLTSPVFYPAELVPPAVRAYLAVNPIGQAMTTLRELTLTRGPLPLAHVGVTLFSGVVILIVGTALFRSLRKDFMDLL